MRLSLSVIALLLPLIYEKAYAVPVGTEITNGVRVAYKNLAEDKPYDSIIPDDLANTIQYTVRKMAKRRTDESTLRSMSSPYPYKTFIDPIGIEDGLAYSTSDLAFTEFIPKGESLVAFNEYIQSITAEEKLDLLNQLGHLFFDANVNNGIALTNIEECLFYDKAVKSIKYARTFYCHHKIHTFPNRHVNYNFHNYGLFNSVRFFTNLVLNEMFDAQLPSSILELNNIEEDIIFNSQSSRYVDDDIFISNKASESYSQISKIIRKVALNYKEDGKHLYEMKSNKSDILDKLSYISSRSRYALFPLKDFFERNISLESNDRFTILDEEKGARTSVAFGRSYYRDSPPTTQIGIEIPDSTFYTRSQYHDTIFMTRRLYSASSTEQGIKDLENLVHTLNPILREQKDVLVPVGNFLFDSEDIHTYFIDAYNRNASIDISKYGPEGIYDNFESLDSAFTKYISFNGYKSTIEKFHNILKAAAKLNRLGFHINLNDAVTFTEDNDFAIFPSIKNTRKYQKLSILFISIRASLSIDGPIEISTDEAYENIFAFTEDEIEFLQNIDNGDIDKALESPIWDNDILDLPLQRFMHLKDVRLTNKDLQIYITPSRSLEFPLSMDALDVIVDIFNSEDIILNVKNNLYSMDTDFVLNRKSLFNLSYIMENLTNLDIYTFITKDNKGDVRIRLIPKDVNSRILKNLFSVLYNSKVFSDMDEPELSVKTVNMYSYAVAVADELASSKVELENQINSLKIVAETVRDIVQLHSFHEVRQHMMKLNDIIYGAPKFNSPIAITSDDSKTFIQNNFLLRSECVICSSELTEDGPAVIHNCRNGYHKECIDLWLKQRKDCPMCRSHMNIEN